MKIAGIYEHTDKDEYRLVRVLHDIPNDGLMKFLCSEMRVDFYRLQSSTVIGIAASVLGAPVMMYYDEARTDGWNRYPIPSKVDPEAFDNWMGKLIQSVKQRPGHGGGE